MVPVIFHWSVFHIDTSGEVFLCAFYALSLDKVINGTLGVRSSTYNGYQWDERVLLWPSQQWLRMEASAMFLLEREHRVHDTDSLLHEFLLVFHKSSVIRVHQLIIYIKSQEVCLPLYRRMRQMDKDGKKMVAEFVYRHAVWQIFFWIAPFFSRLLNLNPQWGKGRHVKIWTSLDFYRADMRMRTIKI